MIYKMMQRRPGRAAVISAVVAAVIYLVMMQVTLAHLTAVAGSRPLDLRPMGYDLAEAQRFLAALGAEGRDFYLWRQLPLDMVYPFTLALALHATLRWSVAGQQRPRWVSLVIVTAYLAAACDYAENLCIAALLLSWPSLSASVVSVASIASVAKAALTTVAAIAALWAMIRRLVLRKPMRAA